jgi:glycine cleavage system H lipoate-binding protein/ABC-type phosphate transport system substrate-binding protein
MKTLTALAGSAILLLLLHGGATAYPQDAPQDTQVQVICSPDLYQVMMDLTNAYSASGGELKISVRQAEKPQADIRTGQPGQLALVSKNYLSGLEPESLDIFILGRDVYVPVIHPENPLRDEILQKGISPLEFKRIYSGNPDLTWGYVLQNDSRQKVKAYYSSDATCTGYLSEFFETETENIKGFAFENCDGAMDALSRDPNGIAFCKLCPLMKMQEKQDFLDYTLVPVDLNNNDQIDHFENIYGSTEELYRGIWIGKYSRALYSRIFALTPSEYPGGPEQELLAWMITEGDEIFENNGFMGLTGHEEKSMMARLENVSLEQERNAGPGNLAKTGSIFLAILVGLGILTVLLLWLFRNRRPVSLEFTGTVNNGILKDSTLVPGGYYFDRSHTWTFQERDGNIRVGLDSFIEKLTGPLTKVKMKATGDGINKGQGMFTLVQNGKHLEIKSPVSGQIIARNDRLDQDPALINSSPFSEGWVYMIEPARWTQELRSYMRADRYREWIQTELSRMKDFLAHLSRSKGDSPVVLQEGGELKEGLLENLGPEIWEDFQTDFLKN